MAPLTETRNPFATIVRAHLQAQQTRGDSIARFAEKLGILRGLYRQGYSREQIVGLYRFIDWVMALPPALERRFLDQVEAFEEENQMPYVTSAERIGREEGLQESRQEGLQTGLRQGLLDGIALALKIKFGAASAEILPEIQALSSLEAIRAVYAQIETAQTLDDVRRSYR